MDDGKLLEVLDTYIDITEKQDDIIVRLSKIVSKQATELAHLRNLAKVEAEENMQEDMQRVQTAMAEFKGIRKEP